MDFALCVVQTGNFCEAVLRVGGDYGATDLKNLWNRECPVGWVAEFPELRQQHGWYLIQDDQNGIL